MPDAGETRAFNQFCFQFKTTQPQQPTFVEPYCVLGTVYVGIHHLISSLKNSEVDAVILIPVS